jgi:hypothetical protein
VLREMLARGFGAGFIRSHGELLPGAHEPVIDEKTWKAYLARRKRRTSTPSRALNGYPLSGLVVCASCGRKMQAWNGYVGDKTRRQSAYKCPPEGCARCYCSTSVIHEEIKAWLAAGVAEVVDDRAAVKARSLAQQATAKADIHAVVAQVKDIDKAIGRLTDGYSRGVVPEQAYQKTLADLTAERDGLDARAVELSSDVQASRQSTRPIARSLLRDYDLLLASDPDGLGEVLDHLISAVLIAPGHHKRLGPRKVRVVARWG